VLSESPHGPKGYVVSRIEMLTCYTGVLRFQSEKTPCPQAPDWL